MTTLFLPKQRDSCKTNNIKAYLNKVTLAKDFQSLRKTKLKPANKCNIRETPLPPISYT